MNSSHDAVVAYRAHVTVVDVFTRQCVALEVARPFSGADVARLLGEAGERAGAPPAIIQCDDGTEFTSSALDRGWPLPPKFGPSSRRGGRTTPTTALIDTLFHGAPDARLAHMVEEQALTADDLRRLRAQHDAVAGGPAGGVRGDAAAPPRRRHPLRVRPVGSFGYRIAPGRPPADTLSRCARLHIRSQPRGSISTWTIYDISSRSQEPLVERHFAHSTAHPPIGESRTRKRPDQLDECGSAVVMIDRLAIEAGLFGYRMRDRFVVGLHLLLVRRCAA